MPAISVNPSAACIKENVRPAILRLINNLSNKNEEIYNHGGGFWYPVLGPLLATPEEFENGALFLRLVHSYPEILSTENGAFRKRSWKRWNLKTELCVLVWTENILKTELFDNDDVTIIKWFVCPSLPQTQIQKGGQNNLKNGGKQQQKWLATWAHHSYVPLLSLGRH